MCIRSLFRVRSFAKEDREGVATEWLIEQEIDILTGKRKVLVPQVYVRVGMLGWTLDSIASTIVNPAKKAATQDTQFDPTTGARRSDPATAYVNPDGSYVVVNNKDGTVVQVSNRNTLNWKGPWEK